MNKSVKIYWSPHDRDMSDEYNWNILYEEPVSLFKFYSKNNNVYNTENNFLQCPSVRNLFRKTFLIKNPIRTHVSVDDNGDFNILSKNYINLESTRQPTIENNILFKYQHSFYFFSEEDITLKLSSPFFNNSPHMKYGAVVPGEVNIGSWFRSINFEFNLWENNNEMLIEEEEPIAYISFDTDKKIDLVRFKMTNGLYKIANTNSISPNWESKVPLSKRYSRFKKTKTNKIVLNEIKKNLVD